MIPARESCAGAQHGDHPLTIRGMHRLFCFVARLTNPKQTLINPVNNLLSNMQCVEPLREGMERVIRARGRAKEAINQLVKTGGLFMGSQRPNSLGFSKIHTRLSGKPMSD